MTSVYLLLTALIIGIVAGSVYAYISLKRASEQRISQNQYSDIRLHLPPDSDTEIDKAMIKNIKESLAKETQPSGKKPSPGQWFTSGSSFDKNIYISTEVLKASKQQRAWQQEVLKRQQELMRQASKRQSGKPPDDKGPK